MRHDLFIFDWDMTHSSVPLHIHMYNQSFIWDVGPTALVIG